MYRRILLLLWSLGLVLPLLAGCESGQPGKKVVEEASEDDPNVPPIPKLSPVEILRNMHAAAQKELAEIKTFTLVTDEQLSIHVRKEMRGDTAFYVGRTTNRMMPGQERKIWKGNQFEIWNRGGFAALKNPEAIAGLFKDEGTAVINGERCYKISVDRKQLFQKPEGRMLFDDTATTGKSMLFMYINPKNWMVVRFKGASENAGKPITVSVTWKDPVRFEGMNFWQRRETIMTGEGIGLTDNERIEVQRAIEEMRQQLTDLQSGKLGIPDESKQQAQEALQRDLARTEEQFTSLQEGKIVESVFLTELRVNKGVPEELFAPVQKPQVEKSYKMPGL